MRSTDVLVGACLGATAIALVASLGYYDWTGLPDTFTVIVPSGPRNAK